MSNPVKYVQKNAQSFAMFSALAKYAKNMSILCPNFGHYLDTFSLIFLSWKCPKIWAYFGHQKSRLRNMCKLHKSVQNMSIICPNFGHIMDTYIQPPVLHKHPPEFDRTSTLHLRVPLMSLACPSQGVTNFKWILCLQACWHLLLGWWAGKGNRVNGKLKLAGLFTPLQKMCSLNANIYLLIR